MKLPDFIEGVHYRQLRGGSYRFQLLQDVYLELEYLRQIKHSKCLSFRDVYRREWVRVEGFVKIIRKDYAWNGATPKRWIPLIGWVGVPDPPPTRLATCNHDTDFQFLRTADYPLPVGECNKAFRDIMISSGHRWAHTYFGAVEDFGSLFSGKYPTRGEHSVILS